MRKNDCYKNIWKRCRLFKKENYFWKEKERGVWKGEIRSDDQHGNGEV